MINKLLLPTLVMLMTTLFSAKAHATDYVLGDFYEYITLKDGTYKVGLNENFKTELNKAEGGSFTDTKGSIWTTGMPLPNPAPDGEYNGVKVTDINNLFYLCDKLISLDLSDFNTSNVTDMSSMFYGCTKLIKLNLMSLNTENVPALYCILNKCRNLKSLDLSNFNT